MPNESSVNITAWLDMAFGGVSSRNSAMHWDQTPSKVVAEQKPHRALTPSSNPWEWTGTSTDGNFHYTTNITIENVAAAQFQQSAIRRAACLYLIYHLDDSSVTDAYDALRDLYSWQQQ